MADEQSNNSNPPANAPKVRSQVTLFVLDDGNVSMQATENFHLGDLILVAGFLDLKKQHAYAQKEAARLAAERSRVVSPLAGVPSRNGRGGH